MVPGQAEAWRSETAAVQPQVTQLALMLSAKRTAAAAGLAAAVEHALAQLAMPDSCFAVDITWKSVRSGGNQQVNRRRLPACDKHVTSMLQHIIVVLSCQI
jgi:DNA repair ATPase RecN